MNEKVLYDILGCCKNLRLGPGLSFSWVYAIIEWYCPWLLSCSVTSVAIMICSFVHTACVLRPCTYRLSVSSELTCLKPWCSSFAFVCHCLHLPRFLVVCHTALFIDPVFHVKRWQTHQLHCVSHERCQMVQQQPVRDRWEQERRLFLVTTSEIVGHRVFALFRICSLYLLLILCLLSKGWCLRNRLIWENIS